MSLNLYKALEIQQSMPNPQQHDLWWLAEAARGCERIVELGTFWGASTRAMLDNSEAHIWCVDSWRGSGRVGPMKGLVTSEEDFRRFLKNIQDVKDRVTILKMFTRDAVGQLSLGTFDMVFLDADHSYEAVKFDIIHFAPLLKPGGLLCGHDWDPKRRKGLVKAVSELVPNPQRGGKLIWWANRPLGGFAWEGRSG